MTQRIRTSVSVGLLMALSGCVSTISDRGGQDEPDPRGIFRCEGPRQPAAQPLRRLSNKQYQNTIRDLLHHRIPSSADAVLAAVAPRLAQMPADIVLAGPGERHGGFSSLDQTVQQAHLDAAYDIAVALGQEVASTPDRLTELLGPCATDASTDNDRSCLEEFIRSFGARAHRRPLTEEDVEFYRVGTEMNPDGTPTSPVSPEVVADVVGLILTAPQFVLAIEHGADDASAVAPLDAYELAARLSYHFWRSPPDDELWEAAASGALLSEDGYRREVDRMASDARSRETWNEFFGEWFVLDDLARLDALVTTPQFAAFAGDALPQPETRAAVIDDVYGMLHWVIGEGGSLSQLLGERRSFARDPLAARLYGAPVWDGQSEPPQPASSARAGLITRVAFLASGVNHTRPILKGLLVRNTLLCEPIEPPPGNAAATPIEIDGTLTTRETIEALTETNPACAGCHASLINPLGFATENFDSLGRERTTERFFDEAGQLVGEKPVDTRSVPRILPDDETHSQGAADLTRLIDESGRFHSCFARQYFRFSFVMMENDSADGCALAEIEGQALEGASLADILKSTALMPEFRTRRFE